jgi:hypothetical protein
VAKRFIPNRNTLPTFEEGKREANFVKLRIKLRQPRKLIVPFDT